MEQNEKIVAYVFETRDYSKFRTLKGNRELLERRKQKIEKSVKANGQRFSPIIVNEKMEIVDGQGRFEVFKKFNLPIAYIVREGLTLNDCVILNAASTSWSFSDYINSYVEQGNKNYVLLDEIMQNHPLAPIRSIMFALTGASGFKNSVIKDGLLVITEEDANRANGLLKYAEKFLPGFVAGHKGYFMCAVMFCTKLENMDPKRLIDKWQKYGNQKSINVGCRTMRECIQTLENAYNYRSSADSTCYFLAEYDKYCRQQKQM